jgi:hypothetical protein
VQVASIVLARTLAFVEVFDLDPRGKVSMSDLAQSLIERYKFKKYPTKMEEFDIAKGLVFEDGKISGKVIQKFSIFDTLLVAETRSNTTDSMEIIEEMLGWASAKFGITYKEDTVKLKAYVSGISFYSDVPILAANQLLANLAVKTSATLSSLWQEPIEYETVGIAIGHETGRKFPIAQFTLTRRESTKFSENKYYSEAPLPTSLHLSFLEEYEAGMRNLLTAQEGNT